MPGQLISSPTHNIRKTKLAPWQATAITQPFEHFAMIGGVGTGKSFTGAHFAIQEIKKNPNLTGLIAANNYDQLSSATLREFFYWLDKYNFNFVVDRQPPRTWNVKREMKSYNNTITIKDGPNITTVITRVLSDPDAVARGYEISWYWLDESRDSEEYAHDLILGRLREVGNYRRGLITTTSNGEDWVYKRFVASPPNQKLFGSLHVKTSDSVNAGIVSKEYYRLLKQSYSPLMAQQELDAMHVNILGGRAYYTAGKHNESLIAPWGEYEPNQNRPLIIGMDFNFTPAPCVWMIGQVGPRNWSEHIHWFSEIAMTEVSTREMTQRLIGLYPNFFYEIYGDASGNRGTTSNAGQTDYMQIAEELTNAGIVFTVDVNQANPRVKDRIENMNAKLLSADGTSTLTYNPQACPLFHNDLKYVGWKKLTTASESAKLDDRGDHQRTHATDAAGYAVFKKFPPHGTLSIVESVPSALR